MKITRDLWLIAVLIVVLFLGALLISFLNNQTRQLPAYYSQSAQTDGTLALRTFLQESGFQILPDELSAFAPPPEARLMFMLEPNFVEAQDLIQIRAWVAQGNTLIAAGSGPGMDELVRDYGFTLIENLTVAETPITWSSPLLDVPPALNDLDLQVDYTLESTSVSFIAHVLAGEHPILVSLPHGTGRVILLSTAYPFSNLGLQTPHMPQFVLSLLRLADLEGPIWFDEWHHGFRTVTEQPRGPQQWLLRTSPGRAILFGVLVIFIALFLQGKNFGKPLQLAHTIRRRAPLEYITAMANLNRRAHHRRAVLQQNYLALKRNLGKRYRIDPALPDAEYVAELARYLPELNAPDLLNLLNALQKKNVSEGEMLQLARRAAKWLNPTP